MFHFSFQPLDFKCGNIIQTRLDKVLNSTIMNWACHTGLSFYFYFELFPGPKSLEIEPNFYCGDRNSVGRVCKRVSIPNVHFYFEISIAVLSLSYTHTESSLISMISQRFKGKTVFSEISIFYPVIPQYYVHSLEIIGCLQCENAST